MENILHAYIIFSSLFVGTIGLLISIIGGMARRTKLYTAVIDGDYKELLNFLKLKDGGKKLFGSKNKYLFEQHLKKGLYTFFDSRLNVVVTSSRIKRIQKYLNIAETDLSMSSEGFKLVSSALRELVLNCNPAYFASCYAESTSADEEEARDFISQIYTECLNSGERKWFSVGEEFITLVNKKVEEVLGCDIPQEKKDLIERNKLSLKEVTTITYYIATNE